MRTLIMLAILLAAGGAVAGESWIVFQSADNVSMSGSTRDIERARAHLGKDPGHVLWFTRGGAEYVVRDARLLAQLDGALGRMEELGRKQSILGRHQSALGAKQGVLGERQGNLGQRMGSLNMERTRAGSGRIKAIDDEIARLGAEMEALGEAQSELGDAQGKLGREQGKLGREQQKLAQELEHEVAGVEDGALASGAAQRL